MKPNLIISKPFLRYEEQKGIKYASLCANFCIVKNGMGGGTKTLQFSVSADYSEYLCPELSDSFLIATLPFCLSNNIDIKCEAPISRRLLFELTHRLIPELSRRTSKYNKINISAEYSDEAFDSLNAVGVGWSGGVDCIYTLVKNSNVKEPSFKITHLVNINAGVFEGTEDQINSHFTKNSDKAKQIACELGLHSLDINTNIHEVFDEKYLAVGPFRICAAVLALQKLFSVYYISSAYEVTRISFDEENAFYYEYTICSCLSTQNVLFSESGCEITRLQKIKYIADNTFAQSNLHVCCNNFDGINCSLCGKCVRTVGALYALGKLDLFNKVFDLSFIYRNLDIIMGDILYHRKSQHYAEVLLLLEKTNYKFSKKAQWYSKILKLSTDLAKQNTNAILYRKTGGIL